MNLIQQPPRAILVIANQTCPCPALADELAGRASEAPLQVLVVAPALNSRLRHWVSDVDEAAARARERVELAVAELYERGINARGEVGDSNPMLAIADALAEFAASEIVIATHPAGRSNWLERGLIEKAKARFAVPVTHLVSSYGLVEAAAAT
jgi:nucleotide-binding universal stress UspA family protein